MTEATWGDASKNPDINWTMSAALENVVRGEEDVAEVANLAGAVREWLRLDPEHRNADPDARAADPDRRRLACHSDGRRHCHAGGASANLRDADAPDRLPATIAVTSR